MVSSPRIGLFPVLLASLVALPMVCRGEDDAKKDSKIDGQLVCIGALAGAHIYTTHGYLGSVADGYACDVYNSEKVQKLMGEVDRLLEVSLKQLKVVQAGNIAEADKKVFDDISEVYRLLQAEARALSDYAKSKNKDDLAKFEKARTTDWPKIRDLGKKSDPK